MTKADLARRISNKTGISFEEVSEVLDSLGEAMVEGLLGENWAGEPRVLIPGLGIFTLKRDSRTKAGYRVEFKPSSVFKGNLKRVA